MSDKEVMLLNNLTYRLSAYVVPYKISVLKKKEIRLLNLLSLKDTNESLGNAF